MSRTVTLPPQQGWCTDGSKLGGWWHDSDERGRIVCDLCPRACALRPGDRGFCFVRENRGGEMVLTTYGRSTGFCIDPIEKKPLNHFYPGTSVLSFGTAGCNLGCKFCQNWSISKSREVAKLSELAQPEAIAQAAIEHGCRSVAFTYNDPVIWAEYAIDTARACRAAGIKTVAVTAGYITPVARGPFYEVMDAANVDLKGFTEHFYQHYTLSHLEPVLETLRWLRHETDVWFEITNLVIPRANDSLDEFRQMCDWVLDALGDEVPLHFTAFHPDFRLRDRPHTPPATLVAAYDIARAAGLKHVYTGNVADRVHQSTYCAGCGGLLIERNWYVLGVYHLSRDRCAHCGRRVPGHYDAKPGNWGQRRMPIDMAEFAARPPVLQVAPEKLNIASESEGLLLSEAQRSSILAAATEWVAAPVCRRPPILNDATLSGAAYRPVCGAFVSLKRAKHLRACCGSLAPRLDLGQAVKHAAERSALEDTRFPPVSAGELLHLDIEVWLLHDRQAVAQSEAARLATITIGRHGLEVEQGQRRGVLLPGVAVDLGLSAESFLQQVCIKADLPPSAWKERDTRLWTFEGLALRGRFASDSQVVPGGLGITPMDLAAYREFCQSNLRAHLTGATPSCYLHGAPDGAIHGAALTMRGPGGTINVSRLSLRPAMPLQATLFSLTEAAAARTKQEGFMGDAQPLLDVGVSILEEPAVHGTAADCQLDGFDPRRRALLVVERAKSAFVYQPNESVATILAQALAASRVTNRAAAAVYSLAVTSTETSVTVAQVPEALHGPAVRPPAVAGRFYPRDAVELGRIVEGCLSRTAERRQCAAALVPHAGLVYSGRIAGSVLERIELPGTIIVLGPKHTPLGVEWAVAPHDTWSFPGGTVDSDPRLARELAESIAGLELDSAAHQAEHAIEVELPLLARLAPKARVVGIVIGSGNLESCRRFADGLAAVLRRRAEPALLVISSDMNHFASDAENRRLDEMALAAIERLDAAEIYRTVTRNHISMCGLLPTVIVMETLRHLGALRRCERVAYATSADVSGDTTRVVGYAGLIFD